MRTLALAAKTLGSEEALAEALNVDPGLLRGWLQGSAAPADSAYFAALVIVANGPFNGTTGPRRRGQ
jgi:hypothetical protein